MKVAIVGAGVIGLTTAVHLLERFHGRLELTIVADKFSPDTLSDKAAVIFLDPQFESPSHNKEEEQCSQKWMGVTFQKFLSIFNSPDNAEVGISMVHGYEFWSSPQSPDVDSMEYYFGFRLVDMQSNEAKRLLVPEDCKEIWSYATFTLNPTHLLQWLMKKAVGGGCQVEKRKVSDLNQLLPIYDIVINCTGLSSCKELLNDSKMYPMRGQVVIVRAPWIKHWLAHNRSDGQVSYIVPRGEQVLLGGTAEVGDWNEEVDPDTAVHITKACQSLIPSLAGANVTGGWAGLRPVRHPVRLESFEGQNGSLLIHCYGHGAKGVILSWGCAVDIGNIVEQRSLLPDS